MGSIQSRGLISTGSSFGLLCPVLPALTCFVGNYRVPFLRLGVCQGLGTSKRYGLDAGERSLRTGGESQAQLLQLSAFGPEKVGRVATSNQSLLVSTVTLP